MNKLSITDDSGYTATASDLKFLGITDRQVVAMLEHRVPLGMDAEEFDQFTCSLANAAKRDGFPDLDVRIQGSAAKLFSGAHKTMAYSLDAVVRDFVAGRGRFPEPTEKVRIERRLEQVWPDPDRRPLRRPFDAYYRLGISRSLSDYDVQISSDSIAAAARSKLDLLGLDSEYDYKHPEYRFIIKSLVYYLAPNLTNWATLQSDILRRSVTLAAFPGAGPEQFSADFARSSHFRDSDWILDL